MTDLQLPTYMLAWKASKDVIRMEEVPADDPRRTVRGFEPDKKFDRPAPKFAFDDPFEEEEDCLPKVTHYWRARGQERTQCESRYRELLGAEEAAASWKRMEEAAKALKKAQEQEAMQALEKEEEVEKTKEKELEKEKGKEKEAGLSGSVKGKGKEKEKEKEAGPSGSAKGKAAKEVPKTPKKSTPKKSKHDVHSESEEEEEEEDDTDKPQSCIYCMKKKIPCVPQSGKKVCVACMWRKMKCEFFDKTVWAVKEGSEKVAEAVRELTKLEWR
ncbi:hypothetical protein M422DRAFT_262800 [Sphaerobolus stellatus SS14]|uniref:Zn(2)-C6 fungal-type domain-containing protein n=1 Tax=Sphaerobolus stellatus (strain SS14) TaxID=990650 RepID=A0A0C9VCJ2_SPHS4|nr:hypothetical protein M422DRAFT_262800 [Sphaerobolus stellatus SS14]